MIDILVTIPQVLTNLEYGMSLQFLVDLGDWYGSQCAAINGEWVSDADNGYSCVDTDLDRWIESVVRDI